MSRCQNISITIVLLRRAINGAGNNFHFQSETLIVYGSNVVFGINEVHSDYKIITMYVLQCTTIGSRSADMNLRRCKSDFTGEICQYFVGRRWCSPGALAQKSCKSGKIVKRLNFLESYLDAHSTPWCKVPQISADEFFPKWLPSPLVAYCHTLKFCDIFNICHRQTDLVGVPMFGKSGKILGIRQFLTSGDPYNRFLP